MTKIREPGSPQAALDRLIDQCGGVEKAAHFLGVNPSHLRHCTDPDDARDARWTQVHQLTAWKGATAAAEHLAGTAGGVFLPLRIDDDCLSTIAARSAKEVGEAVAGIIMAAQDSSLRAPAIAEVEDAIRALVCAYVALQSPRPPAAGTDNVTALRKRA